MFNITETYTDYDGNERTETFAFNLTKAEITEMELSVNGGLTSYIDKIVKAKDTPSLVKIFKDLVLRAYGEKSADGKRFIKSEELSKAFSETEAYSQIFMRLATDADAASTFVNSIVPSDVSKAAAEKKASKAAK